MDITTYPNQYLKDGILIAKTNDKLCLKQAVNQYHKKTAKKNKAPKKD